MATALSERWSAARNRMERADRSHGRLEGRGPGSPKRTEVEHRRRWPSRFAGSRWRAPAVFVYQIDSYRYWERRLGRKDFVFGQFGENFTVDGLSDDEVCIGDRYRIGGAMFEVTQLRVTCYRVGIRMDEPRMPVLLVEHHRPGFYFRVLEEGEVGAGDDPVKVADGAEHMSVDIGRQETAAKSVEAAVKHFGTIDVLVNNAGIFRTKPFTDFTRRD